MPNETKENTSITCLRQLETTSLIMTGLQMKSKWLAFHTVQKHTSISLVDVYFHISVCRWQSFNFCSIAWCVHYMVANLQKLHTVFPGSHLPEPEDRKQTVLARKLYFIRLPRSSKVYQCLKQCRVIGMSCIPFMWRLVHIHIAQYNWHKSTEIWKIFVDKKKY